MSKNINYEGIENIKRKTPTGVVPTHCEWCGLAIMKRHIRSYLCVECRNMRKKMCNAKSSKNYRENHPDNIKKYIEEHKDKIRESNKRTKQKHRDKEQGLLIQAGWKHTCKNCGKPIRGTYVPETVLYCDKCRPVKTKKNIRKPYNNQRYRNYEASISEKDLLKKIRKRRN